MLDPTESDVCGPPREVYEWTVVAGHDPRMQRRRADGVLLGSCICGARESGVSPDWRDEHLAGAWPILVPREPEEDVASWRQRVVAALDAARAEDERLAPVSIERLDIGDGEPIPIITGTDAASVAERRVEVLEHQLALRPFAQASPGRPGQLT